MTATLCARCHHGCVTRRAGREASARCLLQGGTPVPPDLAACSRFDPLNAAPLVVRASEALTVDPADDRAMPGVYS